MTIGGLKDLHIYDGNEQVIVLSGKLTEPNIKYTGKLMDAPETIDDYEMFQVSALGEVRLEVLGLNNMGWTEIWVAE